MHPVMRQIVENLPGGSDGSVEIRLSPEELGTVRLTLVQGDSGLSVHVQADRPETLDLMRRHIDQLARDLAQSGHGGASFTFGEDRQGAQAGRAPEQGSGDGSASGQTDAATKETARAVLADGLDLLL